MTPEITNARPGQRPSVTADADAQRLSTATASEFPDRLIGRPELQQITGWSHMTIKRRQEAGALPEGRKYTPNGPRFWWLSEVLKALGHPEGLVHAPNRTSSPEAA